MFTSAILSFTVRVDAGNSGMLRNSIEVPASFGSQPFDPEFEMQLTQMQTMRALEQEVKSKDEELQQMKERIRLTDELSSELARC